MNAVRRSALVRYRVWPLVYAAAVVAVVVAALAWSALPRAAQPAGPSPDATMAPPGPAPIPAAPQALAVAVEGLGLSMAERSALEELYGGEAVVPLWLSGGVITEDGQALVDRLGGAARHGLEPAAYLLGPWLEPGRAAGTRADPAAAAAADVALSLGVLRYMQHLHLGRVDPRTLGLRLDAWREPHSFPAVLREAAADGRAAAAVDALAPPFVLYAQLLDALARYRALAAQPAPAVPAFARSIRAGEPYAGAHALGANLAAWGDLPASAAPPPGATHYDDALVAGVRRFQTRHGLTPDGVLGPRTTAAALVLASARVGQIAMALERLRWLPDLGERRLVAVNIPMFRLWAWDELGPAAAPVLSMRVIVGRAMRTQTPVFAAAMDHVIFRPYWNVPASILRGEILPAVRRDPGYLDRQRMEIVASRSSDRQPVPVGPEALAGLAAGTLRVRQRPGAHNSLGLVKFMFPNRENVYLHDTPAVRLFERTRRDFSHGCIRVADPPELAQWALQGMAGWDGGRIEAAMHGERSRRVDLDAPVDVVLFYLTAAVWPEDGLVHFADDIYGHDATLARALAGDRPSR